MGLVSLLKCRPSTVGTFACTSTLRRDSMTNSLALPFAMRDTFSSRPLLATDTATDSLKPYWLMTMAKYRSWPSTFPVDR